MITPLVVPRILAGVMRNARSPRSRLEASQDSAVRSLVAHAATQVPFYRDLYARYDVTPRAVQRVADLVRLPTTTKKELQDRPDRELVAESLDPEQLLSITTTGSTGRPFRIYNTWLENRVRYLFRLRAHRQLGRRVGDRVAEIDQLIPAHPNDNKGIGKLLRALRLESLVRLNLFEDTETLLTELEAFAPVIVTTYPNVLLRLGRALQKEPRPGLRPRFLLTHSEVLSPSARAELRATWGVPVYQLYDCHECNLIAWDCPQGHGLHCADDLAVVEVLRDGQPVEVGERGEVAITTLHSHAMPLVRFLIGDVATRGPSPCPCGQPFSTLLGVEGRMVDFFRLPGDRWLHPFRLIENMDIDGVDWIRQYRLVQEREDRIVFEAIPTAHATPERLEEFRRYAVDVVGSDVEVVARFVEELDIGPGGKCRPARSLIYTDYESVDWERVDD